MSTILPHLFGTVTCLALFSGANYFIVLSIYGFSSSFKSASIGLHRLRITSKVMCFDLLSLGNDTLTFIASSN